MYRDVMQNFINIAKGVNGVVFMDSEGEAVDFAGTVSDYDLKVIGAHFSVFFNQINGFDEQPHSMLITMEPYVLGMYRITKEYFLLVLYVSSYHVIINRFRLRELIDFIKGSL